MTDLTWAVAILAGVGLIAASSVLYVAVAGARLGWNRWQRDRAIRRRVRSL